MGEAVAPIRKPPLVETILNELGFGWYQARVIIILGVAHSTDTMETIIQAILGPSLRCSWQLSPDYIALLTTLVFLGSCIGAVPMGFAADVFGRQKMCLFSCIALMYLSWLCAISPTYPWMAALRFLSGIFIGGMLNAGSSLLSETMPASYQATGQLITYTFETLIGVITASIGLGCLLGNLNWRYFVLFTTAPLLLCSIGLTFFIQESPVYLYCKHRTIEAAEVLDLIAITNNRMPKQSLPACAAIGDGRRRKSGGYTFSFTGRLVNTDETEEFRLKKYGAKEVLILLFGRRPWLLPLLLIMNFLWGFILYGGATILPVELAVTPRTCLQDIASPNATSFLPTDQLPSAADAECCYPLKEEGYRSLLASASGGLLSFPLAYMFVILFGRRWSISVSFAAVTIFLFVEAFCLPNTVMNLIFFVTRAVASAGYSLTNIYTSSAFQARVRSLVSGLGAAAYRLGILTAPYLGQVFLQQRSALIAILLFSLSALLGALLTPCLPRTDVRVEASSSATDMATTGAKPKPVFRNIFKRRARMTAEEAAAMAAGQLVDFRRRRPAQRSRAVYYSPASQSPTVSVIERTFSQMQNRPVEELVHADFVNRSSTFEIDT
ncbi:hypothetical protein AAHC03_016434 [Spirometra sp. Aus1]